MGCDIHIHVEYKRNKYIGKDENGEYMYEKVWECGDYFRLNPYYDPNNKREPQYLKSNFCEGRNYSRFATLADVRNYGETPFISEPKGLPYDISPEVKADSDAWDCDGHSHSYFTLKELLDFQNTHSKIKCKGMISPQAQYELDNNGVTPDMSCQGTNMEGWAWREWEEENVVLIPLIEALKQRANELNLIYDFEWERDSGEEAYAKSDKIRIVFWFDN